MRRFQVQSDKTIYDPDGNRARIVMVQAFPNLLVSDEVRTNWNLRNSTAENSNITVTSGLSLPTGIARYSWRSKEHVEALIQSYHEKGFRGIRTGIDPAMLNTASYVDPDDGRTYPGDMEMLDAIIDAASDRGWMINLTMACSFAPVATVSSFLATMATRYINNGYVVFNPSNEINCGNGSGQCGNATLWASTMTTYINAIRGTGSKNLILINPTGNSSGNPSSGFSIQGIIPVIGVAPFTTDPNLAYGVHHYRYPGGGAFSGTNEDLEWGSYLSTYPIVVEECGISPDVVHVYDPDLNDGQSSFNPTEWSAFVTEHTGFLQYCLNKMANDNLSMICVGVDEFGSGNSYLDLTVRRADGSWTNQGNLILQNLLNATAPPPPPAWNIMATHPLVNTGGADVNGDDFRIIAPITANFSKLRVTLKTPAGFNYQFSDMFVGIQATSGDVYDSTSMVRMTASGGNNIFIAAGGNTHLLDEVTLTGTSGQNLVFAFQVSGPTRSAADGPGLSGYTVAYKPGGNSSLANAATGYTIDVGYTAFISKIETMP